MANEKDLAMLTIDGVSMRNVFTDKRIGEEYWLPHSNVGALSADTWAYSPYLDIPTKGRYLISVVSQFEAASSTGSLMRTITAEMINGSTVSSRTEENWMDATHEHAIHSRNYVYKFTNDNGKVRAKVKSSKASTNGATVMIVAVKLAEYPGIEE